MSRNDTAILAAIAALEAHMNTRLDAVNARLDTLAGRIDTIIDVAAQLRVDLGGHHHEN